MTVVLVHGNPETDVVWEPLIGALGRDDIVTLSPPGFGAPLPEGFGATYDEYVSWLAAELERRQPWRRHAPVFDPTEPSMAPSS